MMNKPIIALLFAISTITTFTGTSQACGPDSDCVIGERHYRVRMPEGHDGVSKVGAIVFAHGYRGSAKGMMRNKAMADLATKLGVALIATKSYGPDWRIPGVPRNTGTDGKLELNYFDVLVKDVAHRLPIDADRMMMTGFSAGGMMVWNLICHRSELFAGFAPMAGTFWEPEPETCTTPPASIVHIHGENDDVVPLQGRKIVDTHQGQVPQVLDMYTRYGNYQENSNSNAGELKCEMAKNPQDEILEFCLHPGGHSFKSAYVLHAWQTLEKAGKL